MNDKQEILERLNEVFKQWEQLLAALTEDQVRETDLPSGWSIKDVVTHLWGWQQLTLARAEAALNDREPEYPVWFERFAPDPEEDVDRTNAWIYETYRDEPWPEVYAKWRDQFQRLFVVWEQIPEKDLLEQGRYEWMGEYPLSASLVGTYEHHVEHIEELLARPEPAKPVTG